MLSLLSKRSLALVTITVNNGIMTAEGNGILKKEEFSEAFKAHKETDVSELIFKGFYSIDRNSFTSGSIDLIKVYKINTVRFEGLETLPDGVFHSEFKSISTVIFKTGIRYIGLNFQGCNSLKQISIPSTVERIHPTFLRVFPSFQLEDGNKYYSVCEPGENKYLLNKQNIIVGIAGAKEEIDLEVPDCVTTLDILNYDYSTKPNTLKIKTINLNKVNIIKERAFHACNYLSNNLDLKLVKILESKSLDFIKGKVKSIEINGNMEKMEFDSIPLDVEIILSEGSKFKVSDIGLSFLTDSTGKIVYRLKSDIVASQEYSIEFSKEYVLSPYLFNGKGITFQKLMIDCENIPKYSFSGTNIIIKNLVIGPNVKKIEESAFEDSKISGGEAIPTTVREIGSKSFMNSIILSSEEPPKAWLVANIGSSTVGSEAFCNCPGLASVTINSANTTIERLAFKECSNLGKVTRGEGGFINRILDEAFSGCSNLKHLELTSDIQYVEKGAIPKDTGMYDANGFLIVEGALVTYCDVNPTEGPINLKVTRTLEKALYNYEQPTAVLVFEELSEIGKNSIYSINVDKIVFGKKFTEIQKKIFITVNVLQFDADTVTTKYYLNDCQIKTLISPKQIIYDSPEETLFTLSSIDISKYQEIKINNNTYKFKQDKGKDTTTIVLTDPKYDRDYLSLKGAGWNLEIAETVSKCGFIFKGTEFQSVSIKEGIKVLYIGFSVAGEGKIELSKSITEVAYVGSSSKIVLNDNLVWKNKFLITKDEKTLCGCEQDAIFSEIPNVEIIGSYSMFGYNVLTGSFVLKLPEATVRVGYYALPQFYSNSIIVNKVVQVIENQPTASLDRIPASLKSVGGAIIFNSDTTEIEEGNGVFKLENNVWYAEAVVNSIPYKVAMAIKDRTAKEITIDCDMTNNIFDSYTEEEKKNLEKVILTERTKKSTEGHKLKLDGFENLKYLDQNPYLPISYDNTHVTSNLTLSPRYEFDDGIPTFYPIYLDYHVIPAGVLHIFANGTISSINSQANFPLVHVPKNLGLSPAYFPGVQIVEDLPDYVVPEPPEEPRPPEQPDGETESGDGNGDDQDSQGGGNVGGLPAGAIAGIVISAVVVVAVIGFVVYWFVFRNKSNNVDVNASSSSSEKADI